MESLFIFAEIQDIHIIFSLVSVWFRVCVGARSSAVFETRHRYTRATAISQFWYVRLNCLFNGFYFNEWCENRCLQPSTDWTGF